MRRSRQEPSGRPLRGAFSASGRGAGGSRTSAAFIGRRARIEGWVGEETAPWAKRSGGMATLGTPTRLSSVRGRRPANPASRRLLSRGSGRPRRQTGSPAGESRRGLDGGSTPSSGPDGLGRHLDEDVAAADVVAGADLDAPGLGSGPARVAPSAVTEADSAARGQAAARGARSLDPSRPRDRRATSRFLRAVTAAKGRAGARGRAPDGLRNGGRAARSQPGRAAPGWRRRSAAMTETRPGVPAQRAAKDRSSLEVGLLLQLLEGREHEAGVGAAGYVDRSEGRREQRVDHPGAGSREGEPSSELVEAAIRAREDGIDADIGSVGAPAAVPEGRCVSPAHERACPRQVHIALVREEPIGAHDSPQKAAGQEGVAGVHPRPLLRYGRWGRSSRGRRGGLERAVGRRSLARRRIGSRRFGQVCGQVATGHARTRTRAAPTRWRGHVVRSRVYCPVLPCGGAWRDRRNGTGSRPSAQRSRYILGRETPA